MRFVDALYCANFRSIREVIFRDELVRFCGCFEECSGSFRDAFTDGSSSPGKDDSEALMSFRPSRTVSQQPAQRENKDGRDNSHSD